MSVLLSAFRKHPEPGSSGRERGEAPRRLHAVLQRSCLHQEDRSREGGQGAHTVTQAEVALKE